jgi:hypothetical protein
MKRILLVLLTISTLAFGIVNLPGHGFAAQTAEEAVCEGIGASQNAAGCTAPTGSPSVENLVSAVINILSWVVGIVSVIVIIFGAFRYVASAGDSNKINSAKTTIMYALIGLIIVVLSQVIVRFVLAKAT